MSYSDYRRVARENLQGNWGVSVLAALICALIGNLIAGSGFSVNVDEEVLIKLPDFIITIVALLASVSGFLSFVRFIIGGTLQLGYAQFLLKQHDKGPFELNDLFSQFHRFGQGFAQAFLRGLFTFLWALLFVIPGIIKSLSYSMTPFIMADHPDMSAKDAIQASMELMDGHKGELFILGLTFIGWDILCCLSLGIGYIFLNPYKNAAYAAFYRDLCDQRRKAAYQEIPAEYV